MALEYVVTKRVFGFDDTKTEKYVAKSVRSGQMSFSKTCAKVSRLCGIHRKVV
ncbi:DNA-binding protein, partial [Bacteroides cellulosilyticus]